MCDYMFVGKKETHLIIGDFLSGGKKLSGFQPGHKIDKTRVKSARNGQKVRKTRRNDCETFFMTSLLAKNDIAIFGFLFSYKILLPFHNQACTTDQTTAVENADQSYFH